MVRESGAEATRPVGAADVHVETWLEPQAAKFADADRRSRARCEHEGVSSWLGLYHGFEAGTNPNSFNPYFAMVATTSSHHARTLSISASVKERSIEHFNSCPARRNSPIASALLQSPLISSSGTWVFALKPFWPMSCV